MSRAKEILTVCEVDNQKEFELALNKIEGQLKKASEYVSEVEFLADKHKDVLSMEYKPIADFIKAFDNSLSSLTKKIDIKLR